MQRNLLWQFKDVVWDENDNLLEYTIAGEKFQKLMDLCFAKADTFSMNTGCVGDKRLEEALQKFRIQTAEKASWFCYAGAYPRLKINLYQATNEARDLILQYIDNLFIEGKEGRNLYSLEDICFYQGDALFFGTVSHEHMCYAQIDSAGFGEELEKLGEWHKNAENDLAYVSLKNLQSDHYKQIEIRGRLEIPTEMSEWEFATRFDELMKKYHWRFHGDMDMIVDGYYVDEDGVQVAPVRDMR